MQVGVPWFRWKLLGDKAACKAFKALPATAAWDERQAQNAADCNGASGANGAAGTGPAFAPAEISRL
jgi:hypothetical protein